MKGLLDLGFAWEQQAVEPKSFTVTFVFDAIVQELAVGVEKPEVKQQLLVGLALSYFIPHGLNPRIDELNLLIVLFLQIWICLDLFKLSDILVSEREVEPDVVSSSHSELWHAALEPGLVPVHSLQKSLAF